MTTTSVAFYWLVRLAGVSFCVLLAGSLLAKCCRRPIERLRVIQATFIATVVACLLQPARILPQVELGLLPTRNETSPTELAVVVPHQPVDADNGLETHNSDQTSPPPESSSQTASPQETLFRNSRSTTSWLEWVAPRIPTFLVLASVAGALVCVSRWITGLSRLRRVVARSSPATKSVHDLFPSVAAQNRGSISVLVSDVVDVPFTCGVYRPVIVLPTSLAIGNPESLRLALAHEWSHISNRDIVQLRFVQALEPLLWFQPCYWWLRRELRICQDQLADHFAAGTTGDPILYAELLVSLAQGRSRAGASMALSMSESRSGLDRRVSTLLSSCPMQTRSRPRAILGFISVLTLLTLGLGVLQITPFKAQAQAPAAQPAATTQEKPADGAEVARTQWNAATKSDADGTASERLQALLDAPYQERLPDGGMLFRGVVIDTATKKPISGATVTISRSLLAANVRTPLDDSKHVSDERGIYTFTVTPALLAERSAYLEREAEHPDDAPQMRGGYSLRMILKNSDLGEPPFFSAVRLAAAEKASGRILLPDGTPLGGVNVQGFSRDLNDPRDRGSFVSTKSKDDGTFELKFIKGGSSIFWIVPEHYAPQQVMSGIKRGDLGDFKLLPGLVQRGQVMDSEGKPVPGVWVNVFDEAAQREAGAGRLQAMTHVRRSSMTDAEGRFETRPLRPGQYVLEVSGWPSEIGLVVPGEQPKARVDIPGIFPRKNLMIAEGSPPIRVQTLPTMEFESQTYDSKGHPIPGHQILLWGWLNGQPFNLSLAPNSQGRTQAYLPKGLQSARLNFMTNEHGAVRFRLQKDGPLMHGRDFFVEEIQSDLKGVEIIRYTAPVVQIAVIDEAGNAIPGAKVGAVYTADDPATLTQPRGGLPTSAVVVKQTDGRFRTFSLLPDEETRFSVEADGYENAEKTVSLPEGASEEWTITLKKKP